jgi:putative peptide maturation dehydrogenase
VTEETSETRLVAVSVLKGEEIPISTDELELLSTIPSEGWIDLHDLPRDARTTARGLAEKGLLLSTADDPLLAELRRRDEQLDAGCWNTYAALFHSLTKWRDVDVRTQGDAGEGPGELPQPADDLLATFIGQYGKPPQHFHSLARSSGALELPVVEKKGALYRILRERRTSRNFHPDQPLTKDELSVILYYVFGCHGYLAMHEDVAALRKTSPSGGGLHPIEAYPLLANVEDIPPGLYHYRVEDHALEPIEELSRATAHELATQLMAGQAFFGSASAVFLLTARFYRSFWKYRRHQRAYAVLLMDAAHLSQTLYLVCTELGLGAFVTAAINGANIEQRLGLDDASEGALAVCGCGPRGTGPSRFEPDFRPYVPRSRP